ncbi:MAG: hypothetical protein U9Q17_03095 [Chloroflexota bacterium]|nr:hypothetical protein [Chloroflexota bacterium]
MIYQNGLTDPQARKTGCFVRSLLRVPELYTHDFTLTELDKLFERVLSMGWAHSDYIVADPAAIVREGFRWRDQDRECYQTGIHDLKSVRWWGWVERNPAYKQIAFMILKGQTVRKNPHFRLGDGIGIEVFDPYHPKPLIQYEIYRTYYFLGDVM